MSQLIAFTGAAGSGKSTAADILYSIRPHNVVSFATPVKELARQMWQFTDEQLYGPSEARNAPDKRYPRADGSYLTPREALQKLGTEAGRNCYPNIWVDQAMALVDFSLRKGFHVCITDLRFDDEAEAVLNAGGHVVRISRPATPRLGIAEAAHLSEAGISPHLISYSLHNDGTPHDLRQALKRMLEHFAR